MDDDKKEMTILVIEDEKALQEAIVTKLKAVGAKAVTFESGAEALRFLQKHEDSVDAIWLDYYIKDLNGIEFMTLLKSHSQLENIPVIVVSNSASEDKVHRMLALGAKKYLLKAEHTLDEIVKTFLEIIDKK